MNNCTLLLHLEYSLRHSTNRSKINIHGFCYIDLSYEVVEEKNTHTENLFILKTVSFIQKTRCNLFLQLLACSLHILHILNGTGSGWLCFQTGKFFLVSCFFSGFSLPFISVGFECNFS